MKLHLFLNNPRGDYQAFNVSRMIDEPTEDEDIDDKRPQAYQLQKKRLENNLRVFFKERDNRRDRRTMDVPQHIDYILIHFFPVFNNTAKYKTRERFLNDFGLTPVSYFNLNQSVLLAIANDEKFQLFIDQLKQFIESRDDVDPGGESYSIVTLIESFSFLTVINTLTQEGTSDVHLRLISPTRPIIDRFSQIEETLLGFLSANISSEGGFEVNTDRVTSIEIRNITRDFLDVILENFDIIQSVQSLRTAVIKSNLYNQPELTWDFSIVAPENKEIVIGILDNGIARIRPLEMITTDTGIDVTNALHPMPYTVNHPHGTIVATLAALGERFFNTEEKQFVADAMVMSIKILNSEESSLRILSIVDAIKGGIAQGVRIFNLSVCGPAKSYNDTYSEYAGHLDKLTYENDILIFIATGNLDDRDVGAMQDSIEAPIATHLHTYPNHFFNPLEISDEHVCEATNICIPGESLNNITVGAIADNIDKNGGPGITPFKELPAYYTRKWHMDYSRKVNGRFIARKQTNNNIRKPDIVMPGGDLLAENARMLVPGLGQNGNDYFVREAGTSLAAPLAANIAARILKQYPDFTMQSVKALLINSATQLTDSSFLEPLVNKVKDELSRNYYNKRFAALDKKEKMAISIGLNAKQLYNRLTGYGVPDAGKALYSDRKRVTVVIQDSITLGSHKVIKVKLPEYLLQYRRNNKLLNIKGTLCYKFNPVLNSQLGYNPIHISFNVLGCVVADDPTRTAHIVADKKHKWYAPFIRGLTEDAAISKAKNKALAVKTNLEQWSEDFYPSSSKPFSNTQPFELNISKNEILKTNNEISIAIRCTYKRDAGEGILADPAAFSHPFSIVLELSEKASEELNGYDLYDELMAINRLELRPLVLAEVEGLTTDLDDLEL